MSHASPGFLIAGGWSFSQAEDFENDLLEDSIGQRVIDDLVGRWQP